ncbi:ISL3 family transposase [Streptomyces sp. NPDC052109]|uniref:ISL3 family transposase n=1 Tax=Streptomyces sp. NPDC052109 TaxID=3155527 RepID=UPI0034179773
MGVSSIEDVLFPGIDVRLEGVSVTTTMLFVDAAACGRPPSCPGCRWRGRRVHSTYRRNLSERPFGGQKLVVRLQVRRFFCDRNSCARRTFVEQVDRLTERYRRFSLGLKEWLTTVAVERLCRKLNLAAGRTCLVELLEEPPAPEQAPRVLGVDEFALRRGRRYGTILVDVEAGRVVDVLPDRTSETFGAWLTSHPGAEIICRDRASAYTKAIKEAAPDAMEVADRWHLLQNLSDAIEKTCHQHRPCLKKHAERGGDRPIQMPLVDALPPTRIVQRVLQHHAELTRMVAAGHPLSDIARRLGLDRKTVRRYRDTSLDHLLDSARDRRPEKLDAFKPFLQQQYAVGITNGRILFQQIRERGFRGGYSTLTPYLRTLKAGTAPTAPAEIPSPRRITSWIMRNRELLSTQEVEHLDQARLACPDIARACDLARAFTDLVRNRRGQLLPAWIRQAEHSDVLPVAKFAAFLRQDFDAVTAGPTHEWSSGKVEGHVNRVKTIKRAMYGRAGFRLLRTRTLSRT